MEITQASSKYLDYRKVELKATITLYGDSTPAAVLKEYHEICAEQQRRRDAAMAVQEGTQG
jgi:hypothetical protein